MVEYKELKTSNIVKLTKKGDSYEGEFLSIESSSLYADSWALNLKDQLNENITIFVNKIVFDLINKNQVVPGDKIKLLFEGKVTSKISGKAYNDYKLFISK
jgi:hypothetical protein